VLNDLLLPIEDLLETAEPTHMQLAAAKRKKHFEFNFSFYFCWE